MDCARAEHWYAYIEAVSLVLRNMTVQFTELFFPESPHVAFETFVAIFCPLVRPKPQLARRCSRGKMPLLFAPLSETASNVEPFSVIVS
jgi:hypothetical protein